MLSRCLVLKLLFLLAWQTAFAQAGGTPVPSDAESFDVQAVVKQAVANFNAREAMPKDYTYLETVKAEDSRLKNGRSTDVYEIIEINGHAFRRHLERDGKKIAQQEKRDDADRDRWLEVEHRILEEQIKPGHTRESLEASVRKIMEDAGLKDWQPQLLAPTHMPSMGVVYFTQTLYQFRLPIAELDQKFDLKSKGEKILNGRTAYVIQATPKHTKDKTDAAANFKIKVWIDEKEVQVVKVEGDALRMGPLAAPEYSSFTSKTLSEKEVEEQKQRLASSELYYGDDTKIMQEWTKVNDEVWLLRRRHVKGSHVLLLKEQIRPTFSSDVEYDIEDSNYKKFRVQHRFLSRVVAARQPALEQR